MKKTVITVVLALCVISTVCCAYAAAAESAKTDVILICPQEILCS